MSSEKWGVLIAFWLVGTVFGILISVVGGFLLMVIPWVFFCMLMLKWYPAPWTIGPEIYGVELMVIGYRLFIVLFTVWFADQIGKQGLKWLRGRREMSGKGRNDQRN